MPLHYYAALAATEEDALLHHLASCPACAREWIAVRRSLDAADAATVFPLEAEVDWRQFTRATVARARAADTEGRGAPLRPWPIAIPAAAGLAALAAAAVVALMMARVPQPASQAGGSPPDVSLLESVQVLEGRLARRGAARYLTDSRALLVNILGTASRCRRPDGRYDISLEKEKSRQLLRRKNLYETDLRPLEDQRLATLLRQLESVLMEVTALDDCASARQIHDLREQIETRQIVLRIDLVTRAMRGRANVV
jgi:hypothetical protein